MTETSKKRVQRDVKLTLIEGGRRNLCAQIVQDLLHFRVEEARKKCDLLMRRGDLELVGGTSPAGHGDRLDGAG